MVSSIIALCCFNVSFSSIAAASVLVAVTHNITIDSITKSKEKREFNYAYKYYILATPALASILHSQLATCQFAFKTTFTPIVLLLTSSSLDPMDVGQQRPSSWVMKNFVDIGARPTIVRCSLVPYYLNEEIANCKRVFVGLMLCVWKSEHLPIRRRLLRTLVVLRVSTFFNSKLVALRKGWAQLFVLLALAPRIDRVPPRVLGVCMLEGMNNRR